MRQTEREEQSIRSRMETIDVQYNVWMYIACVDARESLLQQSKDHDAQSLEYGKKIFKATCREENAWRAETTGKGRPEKYCCCCGEDFPIAKEPADWTKGQLCSLEHVSAEIRYMFPHGVDGSHGGGYLCGNCYFDLTGED